MSMANRPVTSARVLVAGLALAAAAAADIAWHLWAAERASREGERDAD